MTRIFYVIIMIIGFTIYSCKPESRPIEYGNDECSFCRMNITDNQHASEMVTDKNKVYKYDAIECMINDYSNHEYHPDNLYLVADYTNPGNLIDAKAAYYIISEEIPSPMGAYLSAGKDKKAVEALVSSSEDKIYTWEELKAELLP